MICQPEVAMVSLKRRLVRVACTGLLVSALPGAILQAAAQQADGSNKKEVIPDSSQPLVAKVESQPKTPEPIIADTKIAELPDSPGTMVGKTEDSKQPSGTDQEWQLASAAQQSGQSQSSSNQSEPGPQKPVGTAAAESPNASGVAASQPAGVAIAPVKQRRSRTIVLRVGAIIGAGVAVGTVVALTAATSSKPPGAK
jgi:hypothetical protein